MEYANKIIEYIQKNDVEYHPNVIPLALNTLEHHIPTPKKKDVEELDNLNSKKRCWWE